MIATREEQDSLTHVSLMIEDLVVKKVENFRSHFPFGCPKDDLKVTFKLFNLVGHLPFSAHHSPLSAHHSI